MHGSRKFSNGGGGGGNRGGLNPYRSLGFAHVQKGYQDIRQPFVLFVICTCSLVVSHFDWVVIALVLGHCLHFAFLDIKNRHIIQSNLQRFFFCSV